MLLNTSSAVTVNEKPVPALAVLGAVTTKWFAVAAFTVTGPPVPVKVVATVSVAVIDWGPAAWKVAVKEPTPPLRVLVAGRKLAEASVLVKPTVPV